MHLFDRKLLKQRQHNKAPSFNQHDFLFSLTAQRLTDRLLDVRRDFPAVLELGYRSPHLHEHTQQTGKSSHYITSQAIYDEELLPFADNSFDLVISNLCLHWINDLPGTLAQIRRILKPDGLFLAAMIGGDTLQELRQSFLHAESSIMCGAAARISPMIEIKDAGNLLARAGFTLPVSDFERLHLSYQTPIHLMHELRAIGGTNALLKRDKRPIRRDVLGGMLAYYTENFPDPEDPARITASVDVIYLSGWKDHASQQKPLRPGSAKQSLRDVLS